MTATNQIWFKTMLMDHIVGRKFVLKFEQKKLQNFLRKKTQTFLLFGTNPPPWSISPQMQNVLHL